LRLAQSTVWVEAGDRIPEACDCVVDSDAIAQTDGMVEVMAEAIPGQGVCRSGGYIAQGSPAITAGRRIRPLDLLRARAAGLQSLNVCRPRLRVVNIPAASGSVATARLIAESAGNCGAHVDCAEASGRDAQAIATAIDAGTCDLLVTTGGSGVGRSDAVIAALARRGQVVAHGIALRPGRTAAVGRIGNVPVIALPGAPDQALAAWWTLVLPVLDRLCGRQPPPTLALPLRRKIASSVGIAEIVLLERSEGTWMPLAVGDISLDTVAQADAWLAVPASSEGFAAGAAVSAYLLRE
jgi:molybdopterin biosynthesis enzyme